MTDKELNPERWHFYDVDLNKVREELAKDIYFVGKGADGKEVDQAEFRERQEF